MNKKELEERRKRRLKVPTAAEILKNNIEVEKQWNLIMKEFGIKP
jgi:hypothetical protein